MRIGLAALALLCACNSKPAAPPAPVPSPPIRYGTRLVDGGQDTPIVRWLDVSSRPLEGVLLAILRHMDAKYIPDGGIVATLPDGAPVPGVTTTHETGALASCAQAGRYAIPMTATVALEWATLKAVCVARVDAGATGPCTIIATAPALVTSLDSSWVYDGGLCWWQDGGTVTPPPPPDDFDGGTP